MAGQESGCPDKEGVFMIPARQEGYSLKKWCLKQWIYSHGYTQPYVARRLGVSAEEFKRKLREHVLYFPTLEMRRRIYKEVFG